MYLRDGYTHLSLAVTLDAGWLGSRLACPDPRWKEIRAGKLLRNYEVLRVFGVTKKPEIYGSKTTRRGAVVALAKNGMLHSAP